MCTAQILTGGKGMEKIEQNTKIELTDDEGEKLELYVMEKTEFNGHTYVLAEDTPADDFEAEEVTAYILRVEDEQNDELVFSIIDDEKEMDAVAAIFEELLEGEVELIAEE